MSKFISLLCAFCKSLRNVKDVLFIFEETCTLAHSLLEFHHDFAIFAPIKSAERRTEARDTNL